jgi:signal transduction histidine kinase
MHLDQGAKTAAGGTGRDTVVQEYPFQRKDGAELWIRDEKRLLRNPAGELVEVVGSWSDITERRIAEEVLSHSREQLRALAAHLQSVREEERKRIAREIHDELGQSLTGFKMDLAWIRNRLQDESGPVARGPLLGKIGAMVTLLDGMAGLMRKLCTELRPGILDDLGLSAAIEWQAREFQKRTGIRCESEIELGDLKVDPKRSIATFRILQEILTNAARHARASRVKVLVKHSGTSLLLEVTDNGRGIRENEKAGTRSLGLLGLRERAIILGGEVAIEGRPGHGTTVRVEVPIPGPDDDSAAGDDSRPLG